MSDPSSSGIHPSSRPPPVRRVWGHQDGRTKAARQVRRSTEQLVAHCGGAPNAIQARYIDLAVQLEIRLAEMDHSHAKTGKIDQEAYQLLLGHYSKALAFLSVPGKA